MRKLPLNDLVVLNTRPRQQQSALNEAIARAGGKAISFPLLRVEQLHDADAIQQIRMRIRRIPQDHALIFVSANAAQIAAPYIIDELGEHPQLPHVMSVGPSTAEKLRELLGVHASYPDNGFTSEDLLSLPELQSVNGKHILILRGSGGRETLRESLEERGARVDYLELYDRLPETASFSDLQSVLNEESVNTIVITSGEALEHLLNLAAGVGTNAFDSISWVVPSARVAALAHRAGCQKVIQADSAGDAAIVAALCTIADNMS